MPQKSTWRPAEQILNERWRKAASKKVGNAEMQFGRETDHGCCDAKIAKVAKKGEREPSIQESKLGKWILIAICLESERGWFPAFLQPVGFKAWNLKICGIGCGRVQGTLGFLLERRSNKQPMDIQWERVIWRAPEAHSVEVICSSQSLFQRDGIHRKTPSKNKRTDSHHFPLLSRSTGQPVGTSKAMALAK